MSVPRNPYLGKCGCPTKENVTLWEIEFIPMSYYRLANCLDLCKGCSSPQDDHFEKISWDIYNSTYGSPKTRSAMFHAMNKIIPDIIDEMTVYERAEIIRLILDQQERRRELGVELFPFSDVSLLALQSDNIEAGSSITDNSNNIIEGGENQEVIVRYLDESPGTTVSHNPVLDKTFYGDFVEDHALEKYLSRPLSISTITWAEGANLNTTIQPWDLFFNNTQVKKKIENYARLSCNLHVKVIINASPFYYGAGLVSYQPLTNFNSSTISASLTTNGDAHICALSQQPHFWIYPQNNQGGELVLPFLHYKTWLSVGVRTDFQDMGSLTIQSPTVLLNANSVVGAGVTVQVYAWASNVKLCGPTSALALQTDEYGVVSGPASAVASVAKKLSAVPMIGPYARATEIIASGVGSLAKLFGFTNVPVIEDVKPMKNLPFHSFSTCEISEPIDKLVMDPKNELSIDSRICGHDGIDELLLSNFVQRESYLLQATWSAAHTTGQVLVRANVTPNTKIIENHTVDYIQGIPMSHAFSLFRYWRGDIIYRFRFICSKFHRGRVKIQWDVASAIAAAQDANLIHTEIVDIASDTDVEFRVPYLGTQPFLRNDLVSTVASSYASANIVNTGTITTYDGNKHNGRLILSVLTQQTSPVSSADVIILVSARAAENMTFATPQTPPIFMSQFDLQSEEITSLSTSGFNYDRTEHYDMTNQGPVLDDEIFSVCMGERITSLRQLLRRTTLHRSWLISASPSATVFNYYTSNHARLPLQFGYDPNGINTADSTLSPGNNKPFNFVYPSFITWISTCFVGYRGSINWHYNVDDTHYINTIKPTRLNGIAIASGDYALVSAPVVTSNSKFARDSCSIRTSGGAACSLYNTRTQAGVAVQYPMYSYYRMMTPNSTKVVLGSNIDGSDIEHCRLELSLQPHGSGNPDIANVDFYVSAGTDFNPIFFINVPTMINYGLYPTAI